MIRFATAALILFPVAGLASDGWPLIRVDGIAPGYTATLSMDQPGQVHGRAPCNRYAASQTGDLPGFKVEAVMSTKMACAAMAEEQAFLDLLSQMDHAEPTETGVTLTGAGHEMVFSGRP